MKENIVPSCYLVAWLWWLRDEKISNSRGEEYEVPPCLARASRDMSMKKGDRLVSNEVRIRLEHIAYAVHGVKIS